MAAVPAPPQRRIPKPAGRVFSCPHCQLTGHRYLIAAASIAARLLRANGGDHASHHAG